MAVVLGRPIRLKRSIQCLSAKESPRRYLLREDGRHRGEQQRQCNGSSHREETDMVAYLRTGMSWRYLSTSARMRIDTYVVSTIHTISAVESRTCSLCM